MALKKKHIHIHTESVTSVTIQSWLEESFDILFFFTALFFQMMDERFHLDNSPDMTNHQENCTRTPTEVSCWTDVLCRNLVKVAEINTSSLHSHLKPVIWMKPYCMFKVKLLNDVLFCSAVYFSLKMVLTFSSLGRSLVITIKKLLSTGRIFFAIAIRWHLHS